MADYLFQLSISPVQKFISQARKTKDLFAGSKIISDLIKYNLEQFKELPNVKIILPDPENSSLPNRAILKISDRTETEMREFFEKCEQYFQSSLKKIHENTYIKDNAISDQLDLQDYFQLHYSAVELKEDYTTAYNKLEKQHASIKNVIRFQQLGNGEGEQGRKCSICGERNGMIYHIARKPAFTSDNAISYEGNELQKNETLCQVCASKRFYKNTGFPSTAEICLLNTIPQNAFQLLEEKKLDPQILYKENLNENYLKKNLIGMDLNQVKEIVKNQILKRNKMKDSDLPRYYAMIMFDGDKMGKLFSGEELKDNVDLEEFHSQAAKAISHNAIASKEIMGIVGKTVYAGGDDFFGFCTLDKLVPTLEQLYTSFHENVHKKLIQYKKYDDEITMSAGVVIAHYKTPLHIVLNWLRKIEKAAKEEGRRNSFAIAVLKHSGEIHKSFLKWNDKDESNLDIIAEIVDKLRSKMFSTNFIHTIESEFKNINYESEPYISLFNTELKRILNRSYLLKQDKKEAVEKMEKLCVSLSNQCEDNRNNYFSLMKIIDFLSRKLGGVR